MSRDDSMDRRQFGARLAVSSTAMAWLATGCASRADEPQPTETPKSTEPAEDRDERPRKPPLELMLLSYLIERYPSEHFDDETLRAIFGEIRADVARGRILSDFALKNSDEPAFVFRAYRDTTKSP